MRPSAPTSLKPTIGRRGEELDNLSLHATVHAVVENQLAEGDKRVLETLARLRRQGLCRHEAVHAIGSVLADYVGARA